MLDLSLQSAGHVRHYSVSAVSPSGWELRFEEDRELRQRSFYQDWHRVERAIAKIEREVGQLLESGWMIIRDAGLQSIKR